MPLLRFISPTDPRWMQTMDGRAPRAGGGFAGAPLRRARRGKTDGFADEEGTFTICSFWYAECLSRGGDLQQARFVFEKILGYANHLGLFAEELGPSGEHLGNFPQAFTHLVPHQRRLRHRPPAGLGGVGGVAGLPRPGTASPICHSEGETVSKLRAEPSATANLPRAREAERALHPMGRLKRA